MPSRLLSAQTHPGWAPPVAVKGSPVLFLVYIARGNIWSGGGSAWPVLGLYWWCEILNWRQPERNTSGYFNPEISGLPCSAFSQLWLRVPPWTAISISWLRTSPEAVLLLSPQRFSLHLWAMWRFGYASWLAASGKSLPSFGGMAITVKCTAHVTPASS